MCQSDRPVMLTFMRRALLVGVGVLLWSSGLAHATTVRIVGNHFVDGHGRTIRLIGANVGSDLEDACVGPSYGDHFRLASRGIWSGPVDRRSIAVMTAWHMTAVRIRLNEDCWLGINPVAHLTSGIAPQPAARGRALESRYRGQVKAYVRRLEAAGLIVIIDLHWSAPGNDLAWGQWPMADASHSPTFWRSVAQTFRADHSVVFEIFNEPGDSLVPLPQFTWSCLLHGCRLPNGCMGCNPLPKSYGCTHCPSGSRPDGSYQSSGTQALVDAIRSTGARQPIIVPGLADTNDLSKWLQFMPHDKLHQLAASFHNYQGSACDAVACWQQTVANVAAKVPVVTTEFGEGIYDSSGNKLQAPCDETWVQGFMNWADGAGVSYLAWNFYYDFSPYDSDAYPSCSWEMLGKSWYDPTPRYGQGQAVYDHLQSLYAAGLLP